VTTPLVSLSSPSEGKERVAMGRERIMGGFGLELWTRIEALSRAIGAPVSDPARFKPVVTDAPDRRSALPGSRPGLGEG
jgi:hypothetical protein